MMKKNISIFSIVMLLIITIAGCTSNKSKLRFQAIYLDMDGTALTSDHNIRPATIEALNLYRSCGGRVGIATGRTLEQVKPFLNDIKPDLPMVLFNGGVVVNPSDEQVLFSAVMDYDIAKSIVKKARGDGVRGVFVNYVKETLLDRSNSDMDALLKRTNISGVRICPDLAECIEQKQKKDGELPIKISFVVEPLKNEIIASKLNEVLGDKGRAITSHEESIAVLPKGVDKADALKKIFSQNGLTLDDVIVFGDSNNDTRMADEIPVSIAMGNCRPDTCEAALFTIGTNDTDSIARVIKRLVLLDECKGS
ncbi:MAG: HAD family hydrolase [Pseudomonadota bacterium]